MKKNIGKKLKDTKGITLIALVITIIVLIILAGVSLSMVFSQDGIFSRAEQATEKYGKAKARETLEIAFGTLQAEKYEERLSLEALDNRITEEINKMGGEEIGDDKTEIIVDGYRFLVDRTVPKIVEELGVADGVIISANVSGNKAWFKVGETVNITITGIIKTYSGGNITTLSATKNGTAISEFSIDSEGRYTINNITSSTEIIVNAEDSNKKSNSRKIPIQVRIDNIAPTLSNITSKAIGNRITIGATATDSESGLKHINYSIEPTTIKEGATGTLTFGKEITLTAETSEEYTIKFIAEDNAGNKSAEQSKTVETLGVIKHIKTPTGLKEVNTVKIYGATVNGYICDRTEVEWQIFYIDEADNNRVYLISKDYVVPPINSSTVTPKLLAGEDRSYPKAYRFGKDNSDQSILGNFIGNLATTPETYNKFINDYLKEYSSGLNASNNQPNLQATKLMLEQAYWAEYKGTKANLTFGGPTLPLFQASYNDTCRTATKLGIQQSGTGYQVKLGTGNFNNGVSGFGDTNTQKGIYFMGNSSNSTQGMWIASPSSTNAAYVMDSNCDGIVGSGNYGNYRLGFRTVVSLQSNVQFTSNADGTVYTIAN